MIRSILASLVLGVVLWNCSDGKKERAVLLHSVDSLRYEIAMQQRAGETLSQMGMLIDSIDASRYALRVKLEKGTTYEDYVVRMRDINGYLKKGQQRITVLENKLKDRQASSRLPSSFVASVKKLKHDLEKRNKELTEVQMEVLHYRKEHNNLIQTLAVQEAELNEKNRQLENKKLELARLDKNRKALVLQTRRFEAESYYVRACAVEAAADRTHFAPKKKKQTQKVALELYRMAYLYGKTEARSKVKELEKKI